ncbi:MAG: hypothetical protein IPG35_18455 [Flavobacteriales bacterium]|nr:hypothetical protein [Flavobacteriales bacterium]
MRCPLPIFSAPHINILAQYDRFSFRHNYASRWMALSSFQLKGDYRVEFIACGQY